MIATNLLGERVESEVADGHVRAVWSVPTGIMLLVETDNGILETVNASAVRVVQMRPIGRGGPGLETTQ